MVFFGGARPILCLLLLTVPFSCPSFPHIQHSQVQCLTSDLALIEEALRGSEYLTVADEGVKPNIKVQ